MTNRVLEAARKYKEAGLNPIPLHPKSKKPTESNWPEQVVDWPDLELAFTPDRNIGVVLGAASNGLIDVDLDCPEAIKLAGLLLPPTDMIFGRQSAPRSHRIYRCSECTETRTTFSNTGQGSILEIRANKHQTAFPPSIHQSGEEVAFASHGEPTTVEFATLKKSCELVAIGSMLLPYWSQGHRHSLSLAVSGLFASAEWSQHHAKTLVNAVAEAANDDDIADRLSSVETTYQRVQTQKTIISKSELRRIVGDETAQHICRLIGFTNRLDTLEPDVSTDAGAAMAFARKYGTEFIYVPEARAWFARQKHVYRETSPHQIQGAAMNFMMDECRRQAQSHYQQIKQLQSRSHINAIPELSRSEMSVKLETLDRNDYLVGCKDGSVLDLRTRTLVDPGTDIVTKTLGTTYNPDATCPTWLQFLKEIFPGDPETIGFLQRAMGYTLTGRIDEQCLFLLIGTGANGKTTFVELGHRLLGEYATSTPMQTLMMSRSELTNDLAAMVGKRLVSASEGEVGQRLAESKIKQMVGGDRITCRALYRDYIEMLPQFKLWVMTNNLPVISGTDEAIWRRIRVVRFPVTIPLDQRDGELPDKLSAELSGILNWALDGLQSWLDGGLQPPAKVLEATNHYRNDNDTVGQFITACCVIGPQTLKTRSRDLYCGYSVWCQQSGYDPVNNLVFGKILGGKHFTSFKDGRGNGWRGIAVMSEFVPGAQPLQKVST